MSIARGKFLTWEITSPSGNSCGVYLKGTKYIGAGETMTRAFADFGTDIADAFTS